MPLGVRAVSEYAAENVEISRWVMNPNLGDAAQPHERDEWCDQHGCKPLVLLDAPFMCETHLCGHCGGCKAAKVRDLLSDAQATEAVLRGEIRRSESALATFDQVVEERDHLRAVLVSLHHYANALRQMGSNLRAALPPEDSGHASAVCQQCEGDNPRCNYYACTERQGDRHTRWWCEFGTCSREHAVLHYGEEDVR